MISKETKDILSKIKDTIQVALGMEVANPETGATAVADQDNALITETLADGTIISYDKPEIGGKINIIDDKGVSTPAPIGAYILNNGCTLNVTTEGEIATVDQPATDQKVEVNQDANTPGATATEVEPIIPDSNDAINALTERVSALEDAVSQIVEGMSLHTSHLKSLSDNVKEYAKSPAGVAHFNRIENTHTPEDLKDAKLKELMLRVETMKKFQPKKTNFTATVVPKAIITIQK
jgi:hypothetical protein